MAPKLLTVTQQFEISFFLLGTMEHFWCFSSRNFIKGQPDRKVTGKREGVCLYWKFCFWNMWTTWPDVVLYYHICSAPNCIGNEDTGLHRLPSEALSRHLTFLISLVSPKRLRFILFPKIPSIAHTQRYFCCYSQLCRTHKLFFSGFFYFVFFPHLQQESSRLYSHLFSADNAQFTYACSVLLEEPDLKRTMLALSEFKGVREMHAG